MADYEDKLPIDDESAAGERESKRVADSLFHPRFIFREDRQPDRGVDASIELRRKVAGEWRATGRRAWCQLKHTRIPKRRTDGSISYPIDTKNIIYLRNYSCPFYLLYVLPTNEMFFRWHRDVLDELNRLRPGWIESDEVRIRFSRRVDEALLNEIEVEIDCRGAQVLHLADGPRFIRVVQPETVRGLLEPDPVFVGRHNERHALKQRIGRGRVVTVTGEPDAGKRELVRQFLCDPPMLTHLQQSLGGPLALLVVDASAHLEPRILRGVAWAIGLHKSWDIAPDEASSRARERAVLIGENLPSRVQGQRLLAVIESAEHCLDEPKEASDLDELLASEPFRSGCAVIISPWDSPLNGKGTRVVQPEIRVGSLQPHDAANLFGSLGIDHTLSSFVVNQASALPELLLPGVIKRASGAFVIGASDARVAMTSEALLDELFCAREHVVTKVLESFGGGYHVQLSDGSPGPLAALIAMSLLSRQAIKITELADCGLSEPLLRKLHKLAWVEGTGEDTYRLTDIGHRSLRRTFKSLADGASPRDDMLQTLTEVLRRLLGVLVARLAEEDCDGFSQAIEQAIVWVRDIGLSGTRLEAVLIETHLPFVADDVFFPMPPERVAPARDELHVVRQPGGLAGAVAELVLAVRSNVDANEFLTQLREAVSVAAKTPQLQAIHLRALDFAARLGQQRYHQYREILDIRQKLSDRMLVLHDAEAADIAVLKWSASWLLNTAALAAKAGEIEVARKITEAARVAVNRLPQPKTAHGASNRLWLTSRLAQIDGRLHVDPLIRIEKLDKAAVAMFEALASTPGNTSWLRFALRATYRLAEELRSDDQRDQLLGDVEERLTSIFGEHATWSLALKAQVTALARDTAALSVDPERRLRQVRRFLDRFEAVTDEAKSVAYVGDGRPLLVLARSYAFVARCHDELGESGTASEFRQKALQLTREALGAAPSASGWELCLRLLDDEESSKPEAAWHTDPFGGPRSTISPRLRESMIAARELLSNVSFWGVEEGRLALWCLQREWQSQGSLERWAARMQDPEEPWDELNSATKQQLLKRRHLERQAALNAVERRTGPLLELYVLRMRNEAQLQRLLAIYSNHILNVGVVLQHLDSAKRSWPHSYAVLKEEGRFQRYIWNYPSAIVAFRRVVSTAPSGSERREAMVDLVEVLLTAAAHCEYVQFVDGTIADGASLVAEARTLLTELLGFRHISREVAMLRDRADLEAGISPDWPAIDEAFHVVVGDVDAYATTVVTNLDALRVGQLDIAERLADLVVAEFTSSEVLRHLGWLYLRRVDLGKSLDPAMDCRKAYAAFQACRILEMAWLGSRKESATTSYQRGRAILTAAKATGELTPFQAPLEGKQTLLHLAETLFNRAVSLTVGLFHLEAKRRLSEAMRLQRSLRSRA